MNASRSVRMAFTLGYDVSYDSSLADATPDNPVMKTGAHDDYPGGWVWVSPEDAYAFRESRGFADAFPGRNPAEFAVYRLELPDGWGADVFAELDAAGIHHLRHDARIVERLAEFYR